MRSRRRRCSGSSGRNRWLAGLPTRWDAWGVFAGFTEAACEVVNLAQLEAQELDSAYVGAGTSC